MSMDICNPSENSCFSDFFCIAEMWFLLISNFIIGRFYKMRFENLVTYNLLSPFINTVLSFSNTMNIICGCIVNIMWDVVTF